MTEKIKNIFYKKEQGRSAFASFIMDSSAKEKQRVINKVVRMANEDQRQILRDYERISTSTLKL